MESINNFLASQSLDPLFIIVFCMAFACLLLGFAIGRIVSMKSSSKQSNEAFEKGKLESIEATSRERAEISAELEKELLKVRESIILSARAYESTVKIVQEKLIPPALTLDNNQDSQLTLDFKKDDKTEKLVTSDKESSADKTSNLKEETVKKEDVIELKEELSKKKEVAEKKVANN